jgi:malate/lactate dehydrogenase
MRIAVIGAGALGSPFSVMLRALLEAGEGLTPNAL